MKLLIDADVLVYIISSAVNNNMWNYQGRIFHSKYKANKACEKAGEDKSNIIYCPQPESREDTRSTLNSYIDDLLSIFPLYDYTFFLNSEGNFRYGVGTILKYKDNRKDKVRPFHFQYVRDYLLQYYDAFLSHPVLETDDEISMRHKPNGETLIISVDKDFYQLEGMNYDINKRECRYINKIEALRNFYTQVLVGDTADNIPGLYRVGAKNVAVLKMKDMDTEESLFHHCLDMYEKYYGSYAPQFMLEVIKLLYLVREEDAYWKKYYNINPEHKYWEK